DDERLSERLRELVADDSRQHIRRSARGKRNDDAYRSLGIRRLRERSAMSYGQGREGRNKQRSHIRLIRRSAQPSISQRVDFACALVQSFVDADVGPLESGQREIGKDLAQR